MDKKFKLAVLGIAVFFVLVALFVLILPGNVPYEGDGGQHVVLEPYFVTRFVEENPDYEPPEGSDFPGPGNLKAERMDVAVVGFPSGELLLESAVTLVLSNGSENARSFSVFSPSLEGESFPISQFAVGAGEEVALDLVVMPYVFDILEVGDFPIEEPEKGVLVFEIVCTVNCPEEKNLLRIFYSKAE